MILTLKVQMQINDFPHSSVIVRLCISPAAYRSLRYTHIR